MSIMNRRLWLDLQAARYLEALESDDWEFQDEVWKLAAQDPELEEALHAVHLGMVEEQAGAEVATIASLAQRHLPSAEVTHPTSGPVTVGMVAEELFRHTPDRLPAAAHTLNDRLRSSTLELPRELGLTKLIAWAEEKFGTADVAYWKAFREAALNLELRTAAESNYQMAARRGLKPEERP